MKLNLVSMHIKDSERSVFLSTAMLASNIKKSHKDTQVALINTYLSTERDNAIKEILSNRPDIIGFSIYMWNRAILLEIIKEIKQFFPDILIIAGGPEVTGDFLSFQNNNYIDLAVPGEGEKVINTIIEQINKGALPEEIQKSISFEVIGDLDSLSSPIIDGTLDFKKGLLWELSRGCPFNCAFCYESKGSNKVRRFSIERINRELDIIAESNVEQVFVLDPTFNYNKEAAKQILELIQIKAPHITFYFEIRSEFLDEEMAFLFSQITCIIQIGVQSINSKVLETINREIDINKFEKQVYLLHEASVPYGFDLIYGLPKDSLKSFCKSLDFVLGLAPNHIDIFPLAILPGTELADNADRLQLNYLKDNPYTVNSSTSFQEKEMRRAEKIAKACNLFYNEGKAVPWFGIVTRALEIRPSKFLLQFANWKNIDYETDILTKQIKFVEQLFFEQEKTDFAMVASDIITYFAKLDDFLERDCVYDEGKNCSESFQLYYNPNELQDLLDEGITEIEEINKYIKLSPCSISFKYINETDMIDIIFS